MANRKARFRWADAISKTVEFQASRESFGSAAVDALIDARNLASHRYHAGQWRKDVIYFNTLELQIFDPTAKLWFRLGKMIDTAFGPRSAWIPKGYYLPSFMAFPEGVPEGIPERQESDAETVIRDAGTIWDMAEETLAWGGSLRGMAKGLSEQAFE